MRHPVRDVVVVPGILGSRLERDGQPIWAARAWPCPGRP